MWSKGKTQQGNLVRKRINIELKMVDEPQRGGGDEDGTWPTNADRLNPQIHTEQFCKLPLYSQPNNWNNLEERIRQQYNQTSLKIVLFNYPLESLIPPQV